MQVISDKNLTYTSSQLLKFAFAYAGKDIQQWSDQASLLKQLRKVQIPISEDLKRGRGAFYTYDDFFQFALARELISAGLVTPFAGTVVRRSWREGLAGVPELVWNDKGDPKQNGLLFVMTRTGFDGFDKSPTKGVWSFLGNFPDFDGNSTKITICHFGDLIESGFFDADLNLPASYGQQRMIVINLSRVVKTVDGLLGNIDALNALMPNMDVEESRLRRRSNQSNWCITNKQ